VTRSEFNQWFAEFSACFPGISAWLERVCEGENAPTAVAIVGSWYKVLSDLDYAACVTAVEQIHRGEVDEPKSFDRYPRVIRAMVRRGGGGARASTIERPQRVVIDGHLCYACRVCCDSGWVEVFDPRHYAEVRGANYDPSAVIGRMIYSVVVHCACDYGQRVRDRQRKPTATYSVSQMIPWEPHGNLDRLKEALCDGLAAMDNSDIPH
jgi:hypothetical protein